MRAAVLLALIAGAIVAVIVGGSSGCLRSTQFECSSNVDCTRAGAQGTCEAVGFCSFGDPSCEGGRRYGSLSGPFADQCIPPPDAAVPDAPIDAAIDAYVHDARECFGGGAYMLCFAGMPPMGAVTLAGALNTSTDPRCAPSMPQSWTDAGQPDACMIMGKTIAVTGALTVSGTRPLVLLGDVITIGATIDMASHVNGTLAPGGNASQCAAFLTAPTDDLSFAAGGAGGSFMRPGGIGGRGDNNNAIPGGTPAPMESVMPTILRGGCPGQTGGIAVAPAGAPGAGGGAIFITASNLTITNAGTINVSGAGAAGGGVRAGGSGGGTGGMIVLHVVETITATGGRLLANGGGGSAGGNGAAGGVSGADPAPTAVTTPAAGGASPGGVGGNGFAGTNLAQDGGSGNNRSGGGGGGGAGYIQSNKPITGATVSPAPTIVP